LLAGRNAILVGLLTILFDLVEGRVDPLDDLRESFLVLAHRGRSTILEAAAPTVFQLSSISSRALCPTRVKPLFDVV
jgi:hypothetical protein